MFSLSAFDRQTQIIASWELKPPNAIGRRRSIVLDESGIALANARY
jgi:hypothetical protein